MTYERSRTSEYLALSADDQTEHDRSAVALVKLYDQRVRMTHRLAQHPSTGNGILADATAVMEKGAELENACEAFRRRFYPRRAEVLVGLWVVMASSPKRRRTSCVLDLSDEFSDRSRCDLCPDREGADGDSDVEDPAVAQ